MKIRYRLIKRPDKLYDVQIRNMFIWRTIKLDYGLYWAIVTAKTDKEARTIILDKINRKNVLFIKHPTLYLIES